MALTKVSTAVVDMSGNTEALEIAKGTTTERDAISSPTIGLLRSNTTDNTMEVYTNNSGTPGWKVLKEGGNAFTALVVDYLVVAGGGGGGGSQQVGYGGGAGGGAGGLRTSFGSTSGGGTSAESYIQGIVNTNYTVTIGTGGTGAPLSTNNRGTNGTDSAFGSASLGNLITSKGGGGGGNYGQIVANGQGYDGGSGGGSSRDLSGGAALTTPAVMGFDGGDASYSAVGGAGGGGAASVGLVSYAGSGGIKIGGDGGDGLQSSITVALGAGTYYAGGGAGGTFGASTITGQGGSGVGGNGGAQYVNATTGDVNTGSGGGGAGNYSRQGANGGSGIVVLRYPKSYTIAVTGSLFRSTAIVGTYNVTTFTSGSGTITFS